MSNFPITITAKARHGILWTVRQRLGSNKALAKALGISQNKMSAWLNLKVMPKRTLPKHLQKKLLMLTGMLVEDIFPDTLKNSDFLDHPKDIEITRDVPIEQLLASGAVSQFLESPEAVMIRKEIKAQLIQSFERLRPRQERIIRQRFGVGFSSEDCEPKTVSEIAIDEGVCVETVRHNLQKALRIMRRDNHLRQAVYQNDGPLLNDLPMLLPPDKPVKPVRYADINYDKLDAFWDHNDRTRFA